jgi:hypothetical protein
MSLALRKLSDQTIKLINKLDDETRAEVAKVVRRHLTACAKSGSPVESLDRLFIEAVEIVILEAKHPELALNGPYEHEGPIRRYEQYVSPKFD